MLCAILALVALQGVSQSSPPLTVPARRPVAITNVTIIDVATGRRQDHRTVLVREDRIVRIDASSSRGIPVGYARVDGSGRFLIPGLWDMHVHASWPAFVATFGALNIANGVTGVREMFGTIEDVAAWRSAVAAGTLSAPRVVGAGHLIDGVPPIWPGSVIATTAEDGRRVVDSLAHAGAGFIKVYNRLTPEAYRGILQAAAARSLPVVGHVPDAVSVWDAARWGQRSIEHLSGVSLGCSGKSAPIRALLDSASRLGVATSGGAALRLRATTEARESFDQRMCDSLARHFVQHETWHVPTLIVSRSIAQLRDTARSSDPRLRYIAPMLTSSWDWRQDFRFRTMSDSGWAELAAQSRRSLRLTGLLSRAGVSILAGTDAPNPFVFPGFSLHDELGLLVDAGLSPLEALQAATRNPARFLASDDSLGVVAPGHVADLVLLDADPLVDIRNTRVIRAVIAAGRLYTRNDLDALLHFAQRAAQPTAPGSTSRE